MIPIVYPLPVDAWEIFRMDVHNFCETMRQFPPGEEFCVMAMCRGGEPEEEIRNLFHDLPVQFHRYDGLGCDIGAHQHYAHEAGHAFCVNVSSRVRFHRAGWLTKIREARDYFGHGLFGTAVSKETGRLHFRTHCYGIEARDLREYPHVINSKNRSFFFEHGAFANPEGSFLQWCMNRHHMAVACVYWDGGWRDGEWFDRPNIFRKGDQSNLLVFDRHTSVWEQASEHEKIRMTKMCYES